MKIIERTKQVRIDGRVMFRVQYFVALSFTLILHTNGQSGREEEIYRNKETHGKFPFTEIFNFTAGIKRKFPIREFLNISPGYNFQRDKGIEQYLCHSLDKGKRSTCCGCAPSCVETRTCCIDAFWKETNPLPLDKYLHMFVRKHQAAKEKTCEPVYGNTDSTTEYRFMIKSCLRYSSREEHFNCAKNENASTAAVTIPVFGSDGNLYKNAYCARCNMISEYKYANISMECQEFIRKKGAVEDDIGNNTDIDEIRGSPKTCSYKLMDNWSYQSIKCDNLQRLQRGNCFTSINGKRFQLCKYYYAPYGESANYHCWKCNNNGSDYIGIANKHFISSNLIKYCDIEKDLTKSVFPGNKEGPPPNFFYSFTISFSSSGFSKITNRIGEQSTCRDGKTFDMKEFKCVKVTCPPNYRLIGLICERIRLQSNPVNVFKIKPKIQVSSHTQCLVARRSKLYVIFPNINGTEFFTKLKKRYVRNAAFAPVYENGNVTIYQINNTVDIRFLQQVSRLVNLDPTVNMLIAPEINPTIVTSMYGINPAYIYENNRLCSDPKLLTRKEVKLNNTCEAEVDNVHYQQNSTSVWLSVFNNTVTENIAVCERFHLSSTCSRKLLTGDNSVIVVNSHNKTLIHRHANGVDIYKPHEYIPLSNGFSVCIIPKQGVPSTRKDRFTKLFIIGHYVSIVAISCSCLCYPWIITTYIMYAELRTIPGFNNIFMCISLLGSDVMFLISLNARGNSTGCYVLAIIWHWISLCAFTWVAIITSDLISRFGSLTIENNHQGYKQRVLRRCSVGFLTPLLVVATTTILDATSSVDVGYGENEVCWITNIYSRLGFYIIPIACISLFAFVGLVYTLGNIYRDKKRTQSVLQGKKSRTSLLKITVKLVVILGLSEFIGFIQIPGSIISEREEMVNTTFKFAYSILRSCRGIMLWFVYILGGQVWRLYKNSLKNRFKTENSRLNNELRTTASNNIERSTPQPTQSNVRRLSTTSL